MKILKIFAILALICQTSLAEASWERSLESKTDRINCMKFMRHTDVGYIGTAGGVFRTGNGGETWEKIKLPSSILNVKDIAFLGGAVYILTQKGIYQKEPGINTKWKLIPTKSRIKGIASNGNNKVLSWSNTNLYYLKEDVWIALSKEMTWKYINDVTCSENKIFVASSGRIFSSLDDGATWEKVFILKSFTEEEFIPKVEEGEVGVKEIGNVDYSPISGLTVSTVKGIFVIHDSEIARIDTSGLPSGKVRWAVNSLGNIFASTPKKVFYYHGKEKKWRVVFEKPEGGKIISLALSLDNDTREVLWVLTEDVLGKIKVDDMIRSAKITAVKDNPKKEPSILEVQRMAIEYAEVSPEKIETWRRGARWKAFMPRLSVSFSESIDDNVEIYKNSNLSYIVRGPKERDTDWGVDLTWDLSDLVWNNDQTSIDVRSRLMVQTRGEILEDITRIYFERKRLLDEFGGLSPEKLTEHSKKQLRIMELTAYIDAFTGGKFSESLYKKSIS